MNVDQYSPNKCFHYSDNILINYEEQGEGDKIIVFLHGFGATLNSWNDIRLLFPKNEYHLFLIDLKGFGFSSKPFDGNYSFKDQSEIIYQFLRFIKAENIILIGHSYGGGVALVTYINSLDKKEDTLIGKLVLIDCAAYQQELPFFIKYLSTPIINQLIFLLPSKVRAEYTLKNLFFNPNKINENLIVRYATFFSGDSLKYTFIESARQIFPSNYKSLILRYKEIKIPTLIIWGENDPALSLKYGIKLHEEIPNSVFEIIKKCGHIPQEECPKETYDLINTYLKGN